MGMHMTEILPVRRVVLYKHGVGYVERSGPAQGSKVELEFRREDMDDVLKSLLVVDRAGGAVTGVSYDGAEDVQQKLEKKALVPPEKEALVGLLRKLPGYRVRLKTTANEVEGEVVGTDETEVMGAGEVTVPNPKVLVRSEGGPLLPVPLRELVHVEILDPPASEDLQYFLRLISGERKSDRRHLTVYLEGERHDLSVAYLTSAPSWRVTYRVDHGPTTSWIQAWGVVDNWLEEDLKDVSVSLVAGKPISFVYDVYVPRTVSRPVVREEVRALDTPVELEPAPETEVDTLIEETTTPTGDVAGGGRAFAVHAAPAAAMAPRSRAMATKMEAEGWGAAPPPPPPPVSGARVETRQVEGGEFFRYDVARPITVLRGQSAMVPIVQTEIQVKRELVYNGEKVPGNPIAVLRWKNAQGVLERGPVVVLEEGTYSGEGILPYTPREGETKVAFAVDLGVQVAEEKETSEKTVGLVIDRVYARRETKRRTRTTYTIDNRKTEEVALVIEHPRATGWELLETPRPEEETSDLRRFRMDLKAKSKSKLIVIEERLDSAIQATASMTVPLMEATVAEGTLQGPTLEHLKQLIEVHKEKARLERSVQKLQQTRNTLNTEQNRVRVNLSTVMATQNKALQTKYTEQLQALEQRLVELLAEEDRLQSGIAELEKRSDHLLDTWPSPRARDGELRPSPGA
ncbi:MAG: hypothetical protein KGI89_03220 [Euryarchaeota archaeon]|nr:hypothetical protein [Euryarchaeota archaeon]